MNELLRNIKKVTCRLCLLNTAFFLILCVCAYYVLPYAYNVVCGPFPANEEDIIRTSDQIKQGMDLDSKLYPLGKIYCSVDAADVIVVSRSGFNDDLKKLDAALGIEPDRAGGVTNYVVLVIGDQLMFTNFSVDEAAALKETLSVNGILFMITGAFDSSFRNAQVVLPAEDVNSKYQNGYMIQPEDIMNELVLEASPMFSYTYTAMAVLALLLLWCIANFVIILRRLADPSAHPIFKRCSNPVEMLAEFGSGNVEVKGRVAETEHWVLERRFLRLRLSRKTPQKERDPYSRWGSLDDE